MEGVNQSIQWFNCVDKWEVILKMISVFCTRFEWLSNMMIRQLHFIVNFELFPLFAIKFIEISACEGSWERPWSTVFYTHGAKTPFGYWMVPGHDLFLLISFRMSAVIWRALMRDRNKKADTTFSEDLGVWLGTWKIVLKKYCMWRVLYMSVINKQPWRLQLKDFRFSDSPLTAYRHPRMPNFLQLDLS